MNDTRIVLAETGYTYSLRSDLYVLACCTCGIQFGIPEKFNQRRLKDGRDFYCPSGHPQGYHGPSPQEKRIKQLEAQLHYAEVGRDAARDQARAADYAARAAKGALTKMRKRYANGQCPDPKCRRPFASLAEHVAKQHPELATQMRNEQ